MERVENNELTDRLPSVGWTESIAVPESLKNAVVLRMGSYPDRAELVIDCRTAAGEIMRAAFGFTERGVWIESNSRPRRATQDASLA